MLWCNAKCQGYIVGFNLAGYKRKYYGSENIMALGLFGNYAVSAGRTGDSINDREGLIIKERIIENKYLRIILKGRKMLGVQAIDKFNFVGGLIGLIRSQKNIDQFLLSKDKKNSSYLLKYSLHKNYLS